MAGIFDNLQELTEADLERARRVERKLRGIQEIRWRSRRDGEYCETCGIHSSEGPVRYFGRRTATGEIRAEVYYCSEHHPQLAR